MSQGIYKRSEKTKNKMSKLAKERGFGKWMLGKKHSQETIKKMSDGRRGYRHSPETRKKIGIANFKGGTINVAGYRQLYVSGRIQYEHRIKMEKFIGRKLNKREQIHHIDGNKKNNIITNLMIIDISEHTKLHQLKK